MRDRSQRDKHGARPQCGKLAFKVTVAGSDFGWKRLVARRKAFHCVGDPAVIQAEAVIKGERIRPVRESLFMEGSIQEYAGVVTRKRPGRAVGTVFTRRESHDEKAVARAAEGGDGAAVIIRVMFPDFIEEGRKARTEAAIRIEGRARHAGPEALSAP